MTTTIIFKLTNGESIKCDFNVCDKLKEAKEFINKNRTDEKRPFELMVVHPKHTFTEKEYELTLSQLNLVPSSTITLNPLDVSPRIQKKSSQSAIIHPPGSTPEIKNKKSKPSNIKTSESNQNDNNDEEVITKKEKTSVFSSIKNGLTGGLFGAVEHTKKQQELQDQKDQSTSNNSPQLKKSDKKSKPTINYGGVSGHTNNSSPISKRSK